MCEKNHDEGSEGKKQYMTERIMRRSTYLLTPFLEGLREGRVWCTRLWVGAELTVGELTIECHCMTVRLRAMWVGHRDRKSMRWLFSLYRVTGHSSDRHSDCGVR